MSKRKDYSGNKFNYLTLLSFLRYDKVLGGSIWKTLCDCGEVREYASKDVASGRVKSCGKCKYHSKLISQARGDKSTVSRGEQELFRRYLRKATQASLKWLLTTIDFHRLISNPCDFCGDTRTVKLKGSKLTYNYIDRLESTKGYLATNCVTICKECRRAKGPLNAEQYVNLITKSFTYLSAPKDNS